MFSKNDREWKRVVLRLKYINALCLVLPVLFFTVRCHIYAVSPSNTKSAVLVSPYIDEYFENSFRYFLENFKIYVYKNVIALDKVYHEIRKIEAAHRNIPPEWVVTRKTNFPDVQSNGQYALEFWMKNWIFNSAFQTRKIEQADAYFVDFKCTSLKNTQRKRFSSQRFVQQYIRHYVKKLEERFTHSVGEFNFLNHFYVCSHDMGAECLRSAPRNFISNAIGIINTADFLGHEADAHFWNKYEDIKPAGQSGLIFNGHRDITSPPYLKNENIKNNKTFRQCKYLAMFLGRTEGRVTRGKLFELHKNRSDFLFGSAYGQEYVSAFYESKFCLVVRGRTVWTRRFTEVFQYNCIPVIISDGYLPPFSNVFDWTSFSLRIAESDISKLPQILENVSEKKWYKMQSQMDIVKHHFLYNDPPKIGDAFYIALYEIWLKVRKFRRSV